MSIVGRPFAPVTGRGDDMAFTVTRIDVYAGDILNKPGTLARVLEALSNAGANLEFVIARRITGNTSRVFVAPLKGKAELKAAADVGLTRASGMHALRFEGPDRPGLGAWVTRSIASAGLNIRGLSTACLKKRCVCYLGFETEAEAVAAQKKLKAALAG